MDIRSGPDTEFAAACDLLNDLGQAMHVRFQAFVCHFFHFLLTIMFDTAHSRGCNAWATAGQAECAFLQDGMPLNYRIMLNTCKQCSVSQNAAL